MDERPNIDRRRFLRLGSALGVSVLVAGCGGTNTADDPSNTDGTGGTDTTSGGSSTKRGGTFIGATTEDAPTLDPRMNELAWANSFLHYVFDTLYMIQLDGSDVVPHVASKKPQKQNDSTYTIPIREGITFHDGSELTAEDVAYSMNWILDPKNKSPKRANIQFIDSVEASGTYETTFHLSHPFALFELTLAGMSAAVVPKKIAKKQGTKTFGQKPVGSGPFAFVEHKSSSHITLERNPDYFQTSPNLDKLKWRIIPKPQVQFVELTTGGVHQATIPKTLLKKAKQQQNIQTKRIAHFDYNGIIFNTLREPFDDLKVRKAMQYLVDYDAMLKATKGELGKRSYGFMPLEVNKAWEFPWKQWKKKYYPKKNHDKAKQLLEEAGYGDGFGKTLKISSLSSSKFKNMVVVLQNELDTIGINAEVQEVTTGQWLNQLDSGDFDATIYGWSGGQDPDGFFYYLFRDLRNDEGGLSDGVKGNASASFLYQSDSAPSQRLKDADKKIRNARRQPDKQERKKRYIDLAETWQSLYPHIPVFSEQTTQAWSNDVKNYEFTSFSSQSLSNKWSNAYIE
ncbi:ABC transporter substrate-binding protein [Halocatena marina]|uniref:ABC transporter substrate-binding protein n=1 Tax=Halocatena marina TaxID=2934937 RepID=UPI00222560A0|nr:ABC transporter substrate-binding protein [Halocatena marina]